MARSVKSRLLLDAAVGAGGALLGGGLCYAAWLALFLLGRRLDSSPVELVLWFAAPLATGLGCAAGAWAAARLRHGVLPVTKLLPWTIAGCVVGALAVYWYGPMLIAFTMLAGGAAAVAARELTAS
jgi:hypothetical protein